MDRNRIIKALSNARIKVKGARTTFDVAAELGRGGNGVTFVVKSPRKELVAKFYVPPDTRDLDLSAFKRFKREMELASRVKHPYVLPSKGIGTVQVGSYQIPFYLMSRADGTLRNLIPDSFGLADLGERLRAFTRTLQGISYLHHAGIVHRDLKPENILLFRGTPKIADLGIAHVAPEFVNWSQLTVPKERLMNRDYYAPEQRHGDATKVDHKADIYALGCILYELVSGISAARPNLPPLKEFHKDFASFDVIFNKMTAHSPAGRYQSIDLVLDEFAWAMVYIGVPTSAPSSEEEDKRFLVKCLSSTNAANQAKAIEPAMRLGTAALPVLHEQIGNRRLDVAIAAYRILGEISDETSVPYLQAGLYPRRTAKKPQFKTSQHAATALCNYPPKVRLDIIDSLVDQVKPEDIELLIDGIDPNECYPHLLKLYQEKLFYRDWGERAGLSLLLKMDEDKSWPIVEDLMGDGGDFYSFMAFRDIYPHVNTSRKLRIIDYFLDRPQSLSAWELPRILDALTTGSFPKKYERKTLTRIREVAEIAFKRYVEREEFIKKVNAIEAKM